MLPQTLNFSRADLSGNHPIYMQIMEHLRAQIATGRLKAGMMLPGSRQLAQQLNVHRKTVIEAYNRLESLGWIYTEKNKGTFVASIRDKVNELTLQAPNAKFPFQKFEYFKAPAELPQKRHYTIKLDDGVPDPKMAPVLDLALNYRRSYNMHLRLRKTTLTPLYPDHLLSFMN